MINQHLQAEMPAAGVAIVELQEFIDDRPDTREVRKALAVKLVYQGYKYEEIQTILDVSLGSITSWKQAYQDLRIDRSLAMCIQAHLLFKMFQNEVIIDFELG